MRYEAMASTGSHTTPARYKLPYHEWLNPLGGKGGRWKLLTHPGAEGEVFVAYRDRGDKEQPWKPLVPGARRSSGPNAYSLVVEADREATRRPQQGTASRDALLDSNRSISASQASIASRTLSRPRTCRMLMPKPRRRRTRGGRQRQRVTSLRKPPWMPPRPGARQRIWRQDLRTPREDYRRKSWISSARTRNKRPSSRNKRPSSPPCARTSRPRHTRQLPSRPTKLRTQLPQP